MAYFNHAFKKSFVIGDSTDSGDIHVITDGTPTQGLVTDAAGPQFAFVDEQYQSLDAVGLTTAAGTGLIYAVQSSFHDSDTIGNNPGHGGYTESTKSKGINAKYVTKMWKSCCIKLTPAVLSLSADCDCFPCGKDQLLRIDVKGSPALRFLNHNAYHIADLGGVCCVDGQDYIDPIYAMLLWAEQLNNSAILSPFIQIEVSGAIGGVPVPAPTLDTYTPSTDPCDAAGTGVGEVTASMVITGAYVETKFGNCSFDTRDHYNKAPVSIGASVMDEDGDPCLETCVDIEASNAPKGSTMANGCQAQTLGETVLRDVLLTEAYMQNPYNQGNADSARIREIEGSDDVLANIDRNARYKQYYILHNVPRFNNPTGVFDNDQYLITISMLCTDDDGQAEFDALFDVLAKVAGVTIEEDQC
ncbi:MAG: hypothetical protein CMH79_03895 [Nitrospinae bacterium]|nr:hypothetical protein [Nitrospinota bacterium]